MENLKKVASELSKNLAVCLKWTGVVFMYFEVCRGSPLANSFMDVGIIAGFVVTALVLAVRE